MSKKRSNQTWFGTVEDPLHDLSKPAVWLQNILERYPWINENQLNRAKPPRPLREIIQAVGPWESTQVGFRRTTDLPLLNVKQCKCARCVHAVPGFGNCFATIHEPALTAFALQRYYTARQFLLDMFAGYSYSINQGLSPSPIADLEFPVPDGRWIRLWVHPAGMPINTLSCFRRPPRKYGKHVEDIILTHSLANFDILKSNIEKYWGGSQEVTLMDFDYQHTWSVHHKSKFTGKWRPYSEADVKAFLEQRYQGWRERAIVEETKAKPLPEIAWSRVQPRTTNQRSRPFLDCRADTFAYLLNDITWNMLLMVGNNPMLSPFELSYVMALNGNTGKWSRQQMVENTEGYQQLVNTLLDVKLLETAGGSQEGRLILSSDALYVIAQRLSIPIRSMGGLLNWPVKVSGCSSDSNSGGRLQYSTKTYERMPRHQEICRQFCLSLLLSGYSADSRSYWPEVYIQSLAGSPLLLRNENHSIYRPEFEPVIPDGIIDIRVADPTLVRSQTKYRLFLEVDRVNNAMERLRTRFETYTKIFHAMQDATPAIVWIVDGSKNREAALVQQMKQLGLLGWSVHLERLILDIEDPWWSAHPPALGAKEVDAAGGMAPYRQIWKSTRSAGDDLTYLLK